METLANLALKRKDVFVQENLKLNSELAKAFENTTQSEGGMMWFAEVTLHIDKISAKQYNQFSTLTMRNLHYVSYDS